MSPWLGGYLRVHPTKASSTLICVSLGRRATFYFRELRFDWMSETRLIRPLPCPRCHCNYKAGPVVVPVEGSRRNRLTRVGNYCKAEGGRGWATAGARDLTPARRPLAPRRRLHVLEGVGDARQLGELVEAGDAHA